MITYAQALEQILQRVEPMPVTQAALKDLLGMVTAEPVIARVDSPPFDNSAVDGFGVRLNDVATAREDAPIRLSLKGTIRAGDAGQFKLGPGGALKILTGAYVPPTVDAVVMKEFCDEHNGVVLVKTAAKPGENIRRRGDEFLRGRQVLPAGKLVTPAVVALIASLGYTQFAVHRLPKAAVVTTGNELTRQGRELLPGRIYDSNSYAMDGCLRSLGIRDVLKLHAAEDAGDTRRVLQRALSAADVVVSTGGVSVGEFDFVKDALEKLNVETNIWRIAIKPGKPVYFGVYSDARAGRQKYVFGLPGNPVSALVTFNLLVAPAIARMIGNCAFGETVSVRAILLKRVTKKAGRMEFLRGKLSTDAEGRLVVMPAVGQDSHMLSGIATANALIIFPLEAEVMEEGQEVEVRLLHWHQR